MKNRLYHVILLALMAMMMNACSQTPKKEPIPEPVVEEEVMEEAEPIPDPETEARKRRWSAGEMDR